MSMLPVPPSAAAVSNVVFLVAFFFLRLIVRDFHAITLSFFIRVLM